MTDWNWNGAVIPFGAAVRFETDVTDTYGVMTAVRDELGRSMRAAMELEFALSMLRTQHPGRARRWRQAADEHGKWLAALYPPHPTAVCETCGQSLPDYPDDDDWDD